MPSRTELQVLMNEPIVLVIGPADAPLRVTIKEPTNAELGKYLTLMQATLLQIIQDNAPVLSAFANGEQPDASKVNMSTIESALELLTATIIEQDVEYVRDKMTGRQSVAVINAFLDVLGWEFIKETFRQAMTSYRTATVKAAGQTPTWPSESSAK